MSETPYKLPMHIDTEALKLGEYAAVDINYNVVQVFDTEEEAEKFVAEANGTDVDTVRRHTIELGRMLAQYRENLIRVSREKARRSADPNARSDGTNGT